MKVRFENFGIYTVDERYLKYLYDVDNEVYYSSNRYDRKPFLGITLGIGRFTYFIPFSSAKQKHLTWTDVAPDHFLIYEMIGKDVRLPERAVFYSYDDDHVKRILSVLDLKKMIPVPKRLYKKVEIDQIDDMKYKNLLEKEFHFCLGIRDDILKRVAKIYDRQRKDGKPRKYYCDFARLERACLSYKG